jgi:hypothetical protein
VFITVIQATEKEENDKHNRNTATQRKKKFAFLRSKSKTCFSSSCFVTLFARAMTNKNKNLIFFANPSQHVCIRILHLGRPGSSKWLF